MKWTEKNERRFNELLEKKKSCKSKKLLNDFYNALLHGDLDFYLLDHNVSLKSEYPCCDFIEFNLKIPVDFLKYEE